MDAVCTKCKSVKDVSLFENDSRMKSGRRNQCKSCREEASRARYDIDSSGKKKSSKLYAEANRVKVNLAASKYRKLNKDKIANKIKDWQQKNLDKVRATSARRRASLLNRTPSWLSEEDNKKISIMYTIASMVSIQTGVKMEVDHIVPLQGEYVSGLHVPSNLQVITMSENRQKSNKLEVA